MPRLRSSALHAVESLANDLRFRYTALASETFESLLMTPVDVYLLADHASHVRTLQHTSLLSVEQRQILRFPLHGCMNPIPAAGVIEEDPLLDRAGAHLAVLAEVDGRLREAVGLARGVQAVHVGLRFLHAHRRVQDRRQYEEEDRREQHDQRQHGGVADAADLPAVAPAPQRPLQRMEERR